MVIDSHVHFPFALDLPEQKWGAYLVERAERCGINALIVSDVFIRGSADAGRYPASAAVRRANAFAAEQAAANPGRLYFLAYLNPQNPDWEEEFERSTAAGAVGIKLWVSLKDSSASLENSVKVLQKAAARKLPVLIHVFSTAEPNSPGEIDITEFAGLSRRVPECVLIGGHSGANFRESRGAFALASENTYWDISGTNPDCSMVAEVVRAVGAEKVLFGSDGPGRSFVSQMHKVTLAPISEKEKQMILGENVCRVYKLPGLYCGEVPVSGAHGFFGNPKEDHFVFCGKWPFFEKEAISPDSLEKILEKQMIGKAFTVSFDSMFQLDLFRANNEFRKACAGSERIRPLAVIDPEARNMESLLEDAFRNNDPGVWFSPALLREAPDSPRALKMYSMCAKEGMKVYINCRLGEDRFRHRALHLKNLEWNDLEGFFRSAPQNDYVFQGVAPLAEIPREDCRFTFEKLIDTEGGLERFFADGGKKEALVRGSEFPFREPDQTLLAAMDCPYRSMVL